MASEELRVEVEQEFVDPTPDLITPVLRTVLIGDHYQVESSLTLGSYTGSSVTPSYPELILGASVETDSVSVSIVDANGTYDLTTTTEFTAGVSTVSVVAAGAPGSGIMRRDVQRVSSSTGVSTSGIIAAGTANFSDSGVNFITSGVVNGDELAIASPSANAGTYYVRVIDANSLELFDDMALTTKSNLASDATLEPYTITNDHVLQGTLLVSYKARRTDLTGVLRLVNAQQSIDTVAGPATTDNPLGLSANLFNNAAPGTAFYVTSTSADDPTAHQAAIDQLEDENVYVLVPQHQNVSGSDFSSIYKGHVRDSSLPENSQFRITLHSRDIPSVLIRVASHNQTDADQGGTPVIENGAGPNELTLNDSSGDFLANEVAPGDLVKVTAAVDNANYVDEFVVKTVVSATELTLVGDYTALGNANETDLTYSVESPDLTLAEQAEFINDYAESIGCRRVVNAVAGRGEVKTIYTGDEWVPSFYANASIAGLISSLPPQQGLSTFAVPGITDVRNPSAGKFTRDNLNTIGSGGNLILTKPTEGSEVIIRRQRTTSTFSLEEAELSITKAIDWSSFYLIGALEPFLGKFNVVDSFFSMAQSVLDSVRHNLTSGDLPGVGPVLTKFEILRFEPSETEQGKVELDIDVDVPFPVNTIRVKLVV